MVGRWTSDTYVWHRASSYNDGWSICWKISGRQKTGVYSVPMMCTKVQKTLLNSTSWIFYCSFKPAKPQATPYFHLREEISQQQRDDLQKVVFEDLLELLKYIDSPLATWPWDHPIVTKWPMRRQLSIAYRRRGVQPTVKGRSRVWFSTPWPRWDRFITPPRAEDRWFATPVYWLLWLQRSYLGGCLATTTCSRHTRWVAWRRFWHALGLTFEIFEFVFSEDDVLNTAFKTPDGQMEWLAMPFGLCYAPIIFIKGWTRFDATSYISSLLLLYTTFVYIPHGTPHEHMVICGWLYNATRRRGWSKPCLKRCFFGLQDMEYLR
jgi:hypothetical protein